MPISEYIANIWRTIADKHPMSVPALTNGIYNDLTDNGTRPINLVEQGREQFSGDPLGAMTSAAAYGPLAISPTFRKQADVASQLPLPTAVWYRRSGPRAIPTKYSSYDVYLVHPSGEQTFYNSYRTKKMAEQTSRYLNFFPEGQQTAGISWDTKSIVKPVR